MYVYVLVITSMHVWTYVCMYVYICMSMGTIGMSTGVYMYGVCQHFVDIIMSVTTIMSIYVCAECIYMPVYVSVCVCVWMCVFVCVYGVCMYMNV